MHMWIMADLYFVGITLAFYFSLWSHLFSISALRLDVSVFAFSLYLLDFSDNKMMLYQIQQFALSIEYFICSPWDIVAYKNIRNLT